MGKRWVDEGMRISDTSFIDGASGIVNRGCHNPPHCGTGDLHAVTERRNNFKTVLTAMGLISVQCWHNTPKRAGWVGAEPIAWCVARVPSLVYNFVNEASTVALRVWPLLARTRKPA